MVLLAQLLQLLQGHALPGMAAAAGAHVVDAVSYTHLDVYKRQLLVGVAILRLDDAGAQRKAQRLGHIASVSYTHLDVYKRQVKREL